MTLRSIIKEALSLPAEQRVELADEMWQSVRNDANALELTPAQKKDLKRRLEEYKAGKANTQPWEVVREKLLRSRG